MTHGVVNWKIAPEARRPVFNDPYQGAGLWAQSLTLYGILRSGMLSALSSSLGIELVMEGNEANPPTIARPSASPYSDSVWSVWKFASASLPFYMLIQACSGSSYPFPDSSGPAALADENGGYDITFGASTGGVGVSFAAVYAPGGVTPWNGFMTEVPGFPGLWQPKKGNPTWTDISGALFCWPRSNSLGAKYSTTRANMMCIESNTDMAWYGSAGHMLVESDSIMFLATNGLRNNAYHGTYFGPVDVNPKFQHSYPSGCYMAISTFPSGYYGQSAFPFFGAVTAGGFNYSSPNTIGGVNGNQGLEGGVMMPTGALAGYSGNTHVPMGVKTAALDAPVIMFNQGFYGGEQPIWGKNTCYPSSSYDIISPAVFAWDVGCWGMIGKISRWGWTIGAGNHDTDAGLTKAVFSTYNYAAQIVVPWNAGVAPTYSGSATYF